MSLGACRRFRCTYEECSRRLQTSVTAGISITSAAWGCEDLPILPPPASARHAMLRHCCHHDHFIAQWHRPRGIFLSPQRERRLHSLQMGDCIRSPARRRHRKSVQHYDLAEPPGTPTTAATYSFTMKVRGAVEALRSWRTKSSFRRRHPAPLLLRPLHCPMAPSARHIPQSSTRAVAALPTNGRLHPEPCPPVSQQKRPALRPR